MKKKNLLYIIVSVIIVLLFVLFIIINSNKNKSDIKTTADMKNMIESIYKSSNVDLPSLSTEVLDLKNANEVTNYTGIKNLDNVESVVVSLPLMNAQAYALAVVKVKDGANIENIKQEMYDNINMNLWICVSADKLYITNNGNVIFMVMSSEDWAKPVYDGFKNYVNNNIGKELEKTNSGGGELPPLTPVA